MKSIKIFLVLLLIFSAGIKALQAQEYVSPTKPAVTGKSPSVKVKLISDNGTSKTYAIIFSAGDEIISGLSEFATKYQVKSAYFTAIGDATTAKVGWYQKANKMFKVIDIPTQSEITSMIGTVSLNNGKPVVHAHINLATEDGLVHGGHLLEAYVAPTLEVMMTVTNTPLYKKLSEEFGAFVIDPDIK